MNVDTFEHAGLTVRIVAEEYVDESYSPRQWDQLGTMVCWHPNYELGDEQFTHSDYPDCETMEEVGKQILHERHAQVMLPLYLYDHSGISISCGNWADTIDPGGWDTTAVGFIYTTAKRMRELCGKVLSNEEAAKQLRAEVAEYDLYLTGDCGGFVIEDKDGEHLDSCWGFLGLTDEHIMSEAKTAAENCRDSLNREASEAREMACRDIETV